MIHSIHDRSPMLDTPESRFALEAVRQAMHLARQIQQEMVTPALTKADRSPVTIADFASQAVIGRLLADTFPDDRLVGEEDATELRTPEQRKALDRVTHFVGREIPDATAEQVCDWIDLGNREPDSRFWTLDPIDGTKGFLRKQQYAVALGLIVDGSVRLGVLGCPNLKPACRPTAGDGVLLAAERGGGAWLTELSTTDFRPLRVSDRSEPAEARMLRSVESGHTNVGKMGELVEAIGAKADPVLLDSQAKYAVLALGEGELLFRLISDARPDYREKIWDQAAGSIVVEEAGGRVSDLDGRPLDFTHGRTLATNRGVVASNGKLHEAALAALKKIGA